MHGEKGFSKEDSLVTVFGAKAPHNNNDHRSTMARDISKTIILVIAIPECNNAITGGELLLLLDLEHAAPIAGDGFSKEEVKKFLFEEARVPVEHVGVSPKDDQETGNGANTAAAPRGRRIVLMSLRIGRKGREPD